LDASAPVAGAPIVPGGAPIYQGGGIPASGSPYPSALPPGPAPLSAPALAAPATNPGVPAGAFPAPGFAAGPAPTLSTGPTATFQGTIQPAPSWDPYAPPAAQPAPLLQGDPYLQGEPFAFAATATKFLQEIRLEHYWLAPIGGTMFSTNDSEISATFAFNCCFNEKSPLLITPGFGVHLWEGPAVLDGAGLPVDLPPRAYDAWLDAGWNPIITPQVGAELGVRVGVYSDFEKLVDKSIRVQARGLGVIQLWEHVQLKAGVLYLDRNKVKLLPAGGIVWTPSDSTRLDILFPNPRLAHRWTTCGTSEWWYYVRGEYGGDSWTIERTVAPFAGQVDKIDYNDIRVALGLQFKPANWRQGSAGLNGFFEVGFAFNREIIWVPVDIPAGGLDIEQSIRPSETIFLGGGVSF
jgi:hypothetical protein